MKLLLRIVLSIVGVVVLVVLIAFADGATLPMEHSISVTGTVNETPDKVFATIIDIANGPRWRHEVKSVEVLPKDQTRDVWIEDLGSGEKMKFLAITSAPVNASGIAQRKVETNEKDYGGTWTYDISPGPTPGTTTLKITEDGYITPAIYRFMMAHVFGPTKNLDQYMKDIQATAK
jgi:uncharacterized membrane protein